VLLSCRRKIPTSFFLCSFLLFFHEGRLFSDDMFRGCLLWHMFCSCCGTLWYLRCFMSVAAYWERVSRSIWLCCFLFS
jgi:hypothetical protein